MRKGESTNSQDRKIAELEREVQQLKVGLESCGTTSTSITWLAVSIVVAAALLASTLGQVFWVFPASIANIFLIFTLVREGYLELD